MNFTEHIQDYEIKEILGKGGFATVHRAVFKGSENVAIKIIDKKLINKNNLLDRIRQEVAIHSRLKHPSILNLHTFLEDFEKVYLILELADKELFQVWNQDPKCFSEAEISYLIHQVALGISYIHSHNIVHRDISLSNILLTKDLQVKISDFGLSTYVSDTSLKTFCGTPNYISPEVVLKNDHSFPVDLWGLGSVLYSLIVGNPPFGKNNSVKSTLTQIVMGDLYIPPDISFEAQDLIRKLLCREPNKRIKIGEVLQHPFITKYLEKPSASPVPVKPTIEPLNATRLQPVRYKTKSAILSILKNQEIVIEFLKNFPGRLEKVVDVCRISSDGMRILMYKPNQGNGVFVCDEPAPIPDSGAEHIFSFENLPAKFHKKYSYAVRFVSMVREKTPKIVFYSSLAKCELMESLVDFEMHFYNGWKLKKAGKSDEKLFSDSGAEIGLNYANYFHKNLLKHGQECHQHCVEIERTLSGVSSSNEFTVFPVIVGRRPISNEKENVRNNTFNNYISASQTTFKSPNFQISSFID